MINLSIIGSGNVAQHLISAFKKLESDFNEINLIEVCARDSKKLSHLIDAEKICTDIADMVDVDLFIIAVSDEAIAEVSRKIPHNNRLVVHVSGSVPLISLSNKNRKGVFYPVQTFTSTQEINFWDVPICIETETIIDSIILKKIAASLTQLIYELNSSQRKALHVAAVFANNFVNHLYKISADVCEDNSIPFDILFPLIQETSKKIEFMSPEKAQTGPAMRKDLTTIESHLSFLENEHQKELYITLTESILQNGKKL